ncbi:MAG: D-2-hydroxyacid dehydrogenase family protein [Dehalococcoidia bacterium]|nr:D-2-hydroxyacid dehydrogenase family protein [Dehalococcoidia bacterium]
MKIAVLDDYQDTALRIADWSALQARAEAPLVTAYHDHLDSEDALVARLGDAEVIVLMRERTPVPRSLLERLPALRLLVTTGMGNAALDMEAVQERGVTVCGTRGLGPPTAELTWGLILALLRRIPQEHAATRDGRWQTTLGEGVEGKTLGVLGLGRLGSQVATVGKAFGMNVLAWSQNLTRERTDAQGVELAAGKDDLLARADILTIHLVLSARTRGLLGAREFGLLRQTAYLVNTSRGPIVEEAALVEALRSRSIAGAALDVFDAEPLPAGHPLFALARQDNVLLTPHLGYVTAENYAIFYGDAVEDITAYLDGTPVRVIEPRPR